MRSGPHEPTEKPLILPPKALAVPKAPAPAPHVSEFEKGDFMPDGLRRRPSPAPLHPEFDDDESGICCLYVFFWA